MANSVFSLRFGLRDGRTPEPFGKFLRVSRDGGRLDGGPVFLMFAVSAMPLDGVGCVVEVPLRARRDRLLITR
ncbi:hypothetical protein ACFV23_22510 [Streptomyces sp. NPDC059627]